MKLMRFKLFNLSRNQLFIVGFTIGIIFTVYIPEDVWDIARQECPSPIGVETVSPFDIRNAGHPITGFHPDDFEPQLNLANKPMAAKKAVKNIIRPRYYSSELGIREKVFVGVMTAPENINSLATAFNRTVAHLVDKIKFFINADNVRSNFDLKNIVGFTDTRESLRPFHILKYIADNYLDDYDYFLLVPDTSYVDGRQLIELLYHISISFDVYMGRQMRDGGEMGGSDGLSADRSDENKRNDNNDPNYCDLNAGILLSSSVIRKMRANLDWCVRNAATNSHSVNIGKCVRYSSKITGCQESFQGVNLTSFDLKTYKIYRDLGFLMIDPIFNLATILYPITSSDDFYTLHAYYSRLHLEQLKLKSRHLERVVPNISNRTVSNDVLEVRWPLGVPAAGVTDTRHDLLHWTLMNRTHMFMPDFERTIVELSIIDRDDINNVVGRVLIDAEKKYRQLTYTGVHTIYRRFDAVRGMDYQLHLNFVDKITSEPLLKSFEVVKPLGHVEIIPSPYVTESTRIALLLPTFEHQLTESLQFIERYEKVCMETQDNTFLMLVLMYRIDSLSKGEEDVFYSLKSQAISLSEKYKNAGSRIAWVSIRLPDEFSHPNIDNNVMFTSIYARNEILSLVVTDLALRKIGLESLVILSSSTMTLKADFLNRVRMNTIQGFQVFSPIGFSMYPCNFARLCKECDTCDVSQSSGYFDKHNFDIISFYSRDYVEARKAYESMVPIIRSDNDIASILQRRDQKVNTILDMFVRSQVPLHMLRAIEPNLRFGSAIRNYIDRNTGPLLPECLTATTNRTIGQPEKCIRIASRKQIGDALIRYDSLTNND